MIGSWARMCKIIGPTFQQFLPHIIHPLLQAASVKPEIAIVDCESLRERVEGEGKRGSGQKAVVMKQSFERGKKTAH